MTPRKEPEAEPEGTPSFVRWLENPPEPAARKFMSRDSTSPDVYERVQTPVSIPVRRHTQRKFSFVVP